MISRTAVVLALMLSTATVARAQSGANDYANAITVNPIDLFTGTANIEYERALSTWISLYGGINFLYFGGVLRLDTPTRFAIGPELGARLYVIGNAPSGLWLGPYVNTAYVSNYSGGSNYGSLGLGAGAMAGFNLVLGHFMGSLGAGVGYFDNSTTASGTRIGQYGVTPRFRLSLGVSF
jgi:hypothetical protein